MPNDSSGNTRVAEANIANPVNYTGPILLAPGGNTGSGNGVTSATARFDNGSLNLNGTSQAAAHVSGYYAVIKQVLPGVTVAAATAWITTAGSIGVMVNLPAPAGSTEFRLVRVPNSL